MVIGRLKSSKHTILFNLLKEKIIIKPLGLVIISEIKSRIKKDTFPIWLTFEDIVEIFFYSIVLLKLVQDILQCIKNENVMQGKNVTIYAFIITGALYRFVKNYIYKIKIYGITIQLDILIF